MNLTIQKIGPTSRFASQFNYHNEKKILHIPQWEEKKKSSPQTKSN